jgi:hypothetical protein
MQLLKRMAMNAEGGEVSQEDHQGVEAIIEWNDNSTSWETLARVKESNPLEAFM